MNWIVTSGNDKTDEWLLGQYRLKSDSKYLGLLFERYLHLVYGVCLKYLKDRESAKDAVMSIYELLHVKLSASEVKNFKSWLYVVTKNHCLIQLRKAENKEMVSMEFEDDLHLNVETDESTIDLTDEVHLKPCIDQLNTAQSECLTKFFLQEKSYKEIGQETKYSLNEIKSHIQNGKRNLKKCLEAKNEK
jgi:RNA polymerase sigma factor (sigma-70 family)